MTKHVFGILLIIWGLGFLAYSEILSFRNYVAELSLQYEEKECAKGEENYKSLNEDEYLAPELVFAGFSKVIRILPHYTKYHKPNDGFKYTPYTPPKHI
jgi:hypothetical protein